MKKALLTLMCSVGALLAAQANSITLVNLTGCSCAFSFRGYGIPSGPSMYFESQDITIPANATTIYASPSVLPGLAGLPATAYFTHIQGGVLVPLPGIGLACGDASSPVSPSMTTTATAIPCNGNAAVTATWQQNAAGNIIVLIM
ncbi:hypothetical protein [Taibaiella chishuiensis]|uniref:Ig-like domain-containing protein n=1 Tax=Taibaiella chishuiensis TaxID=1434707 RepID=A0A2P8D0J7_9BACT|nr:hypothetical protein [Taibaiella chishuiensis]PSK90737.1 hypothetical protein B0I18_107147 [Taibaiella chishuiensis]